MFIPNFFSLEFLFVLSIIKILENIFKSTIIFFQDGIFGGHVKWIVSLKGIFEARMGEIGN
mgnify:CR=1 FL=1